MRRIMELSIHKWDWHSGKCQNHGYPATLRSAHGCEYVTSSLSLCTCTEPIQYTGYMPSYAAAISRRTLLNSYKSQGELRKRTPGISCVIMQSSTQMIRRAKSLRSSIIILSQSKANI